jgi:hypothetical protein
MTEDNTQAAECLSHLTAELDTNPIVHLCRFLAETWMLMEETRGESLLLATGNDNEMADYLIGKWPMIQGTPNRIALSKISKQPIDRQKVADALRLLASV